MSHKLYHLSGREGAVSRRNPSMALDCGQRVLSHVRRARLSGDHTGTTFHIKAIYNRGNVDC